MKELYLNFNGRINRKKLLLGALPLVALSAAAVAVDAVTGSSVIRINNSLSYGVAQLISIVLLIVPYYALSVKRLHDRDRSGWLALLGFVPLLNLWIAAEIFFLKGTPGNNKFGQNPLGEA